jgi:hypothetical protein
MIAMTKSRWKSWPQHVTCMGVQRTCGLCALRNACRLVESLKRRAVVTGRN